MRKWILVAAVLAWPVSVSASTKTWVGSIPDPLDNTRAVWDDTTANWSPGLFVNGDSINIIPGDDVVFTDDPAAITNIHFAPIGIWPNSIRFAHIPGNAPRDYTFTADPVSNNGNGLANGPTTITFDTGFAGTVRLNARATSTSGESPMSAIVRSGTLELGDAWGLPGGTVTIGGNRRNTPNVTLAGGTFALNIQPGLAPLTNPSLTSTNLSGVLTVESTSHYRVINAGLELNSFTTTRMWNGPINIAADATLIVSSLHPNGGNGQPLGHPLTLAANLSGSLGTLAFGSDDLRIRLDRSGSNPVLGGTSLTLDMGNGTGRLSNNLPNTLGNVIHIGALFGGPNTLIEGSNTRAAVGQTIQYTDTLSIGAKNIDSDFQGVIADGTVENLPHLTGVAKVGSGSLVLGGANTYTGPTTVSDGALVLKPLAQTVVLEGPGGAVVDGGRMVFDYTGGPTPAEAIRLKLAASFSAEPAFSAGQIRSSLATDLRGLGWVDRAATREVIVQPALYGDADLDGVVQFSDLLIVAQSYGTAGSAVWATGDFDYDQTVGFTDLLSLAQNYGATVSLTQLLTLEQAGGSVFSADWALAASLVPEPVTLLVPSIGLLVLLRRRQ
jgi:autotransporter-associated beta strand protein